MGKLDALWAYQETDMEVSRYENEMRKDPTRNKLIRLRNFVTDQQTALQKLEEGAAHARARVNELEAQCLADERAVDQGAKEMESGEYTTLEQVQEALREAQKLLEKLKAAEREIKAIATEADAAEGQLRDIRQKTAQARSQYNALKEGYDKTFADQSAKLNVLKAKREAASQGVDAELLRRYEGIKKQYTQQPVPQPMAQLLGDQCGGCNMSLPAVVTKRVRDGSGVVECENCGRILYLP